ncbi:MAG TPA: DUF488 domain-containing protein [bacterium]|uniref:Uroporphyrin-III C-methyltransferase n=1 Tax=candidate division TA06 bacterium ADurb.Bin417 TaxID=1852828 RepID=A0A1V5MJC6_UNCT6|nr:MAG: hypothetical protein BWY73_00365 [candidate division TA06 bacterium ADurb.Bin417]HNQ34642.1 DUF488 domain-containing protein [bacterium]HNS48295.1 DUF488 domain-containing protein [bacterium]
MKRIQVKRVYEPAGPADGVRVLVDRLWPRGLSKAKAAVNEWLKEAAPSQVLRQWFSHDPRKWPEFRKKYFEELDSRPEVVFKLRQLLRKGPATLLYGARDENFNNAVALAEYLKKKAG